MKQPHNLDEKHTGKPSAGNPHAGFDEAGIGNGSMVALLGHSRQETGSNRSAQPKGPRQSSTLQKYRAVIEGRHPKDELVGRGWGKVEPAVGRRRRSHSPTRNMVIAGGTVRKNGA
jgi:hypothetical protein